MHPLVDLAEIKDADLQNKIADLTRKYFMSNNDSVRTQISVILDQYNEEVANRNAKQWEEQQKNEGNGLDKLINID